MIGSGKDILDSWHCPAWLVKQRSLWAVTHSITIKGMKMIKKPVNCWEYKGCGREPDGKNVKEFGTCPAATEKSMDGIHRGDKAGRACWVIAGTYCGGKIQGSYATKIESCSKCDFFNVVLEEEKTSLHDATHLLAALNIVSR